MKKIPENLVNELNKIKEFSAKKENGYSIISVHEVKDMAEKYTLSPQEVEIASLQEKIVPARYLRNFNTISFADQIQLLLSTVAVIGCGGLGGNIIDMLARLGIGFSVDTGINMLYSFCGCFCFFFSDVIFCT